MDEECRCQDYLAGTRDVQLGRPLSPYQLIYLHHPGCYRAGQHDERRRQVGRKRRPAPEAYRDDVGARRAY